MATFKVSVPFRVPMRSYGKKGSLIDSEKLKKLASDEHSDFGKLLGKKGVYVFAIRAGRGCKPWYVGKTERADFLREAFNNRNLVALNEQVMSRKGTLEVTFVTQTGGKPNLTNIREIESLLIGHASERNSALLNVQGKLKKPAFVIKNLYNSGSGRRSSHEVEFGNLIGF